MADLRVALIILFAAAVFGATEGCTQWCFSNTLCYAPSNNSCTDCLIEHCGQIGNVMSNNRYYSRRHLYCYIQKSMTGSCASTCGSSSTSHYAVYSRYRSCYRCLYTCAGRTNTLPTNYCLANTTALTSSPPPRQPPCQNCITPTSCPSEAELSDPGMKFCLGYVALSCAPMENMMKPNASNGMAPQGANFTCIKQAWSDPCSKCPNWDLSRFDNCETCLGTCKAAVTCAGNCLQTQQGYGMYPRALSCEACSALCRVTPGDIDACIATKCLSCNACNSCYNGCGAGGYVQNFCECPATRRRHSGRHGHYGHGRGHGRGYGRGHPRQHYRRGK